jgi:hypothetical protein
LFVLFVLFVLLFLFARCTCDVELKPIAREPPPTGVVGTVRAEGSVETQENKNDKRKQDQLLANLF